MPPLKVLFASSEVVPFRKTGGLADVAGALRIDTTSHPPAWSAPFPLDGSWMRALTRNVSGSGRTPLR